MSSPVASAARRARAASAAGLLALFLAAQVSTAWHEATVVHSICAEHGERVDVHAERGDHARPASAGDTAALTSGRDAAAEAHGHCDVLVRRRDDDAPPSSNWVSLASAPSLTVPVGAERPAQQPVTALSVAPKSSPPARLA